MIGKGIFLVVDPAAAGDVSRRRKIIFGKGLEWRFGEAAIRSLRLEVRGWSNRKSNYLTSNFQFPTSNRRRREAELYYGPRKRPGDEPISTPGRNIDYDWKGYFLSSVQ